MKHPAAAASLGLNHSRPGSRRQKLCRPSCLRILHRHNVTHLQPNRLFFSAPPHPPTRSGRNHGWSARRGGLAARRLRVTKLGAGRGAPRCLQLSPDWDDGWCRLWEYFGPRFMHPNAAAVQMLASSQPGRHTALSPPSGLI